MSEENKVPSGNDQTQAGGQTDPNQGDNKAKDVVTYETHRKLLGEKKRVQDEYTTLQRQLEEYQSEKTQREEKELKDKDEWKKLVDIREKENTELKTRLAQYEKNTVDARKLDAVLKTLNVDVKSQYWNLVDVDKIVIDPSNNEVDEMSVTKYVEEFRNIYPEILAVKGKAPQPTNHPQGFSTQGKSVGDMSQAEKLHKAANLLTGST